MNEALPDPLAYLLPLRISVEDSLAGARAAVAAGATCLFVSHGEVPDTMAREVTPHVVVSLTRLPVTETRD